MSEEEVVPSKALWLTVVLIVFVVAVFLLTLALPPSGFSSEPLRTPTQTIATEEATATREKTEGGAVKIVVMGGEIEATKYGFALEGQDLQSPGPDIRVKVGTLVAIVFKNIGNLPHTFAITEEKRFDAEPLWGVQLGTPTNPIGPGNSESITFTPNRAGTYYYVCQVPGHIELGMWGQITAEE